VLVHCNVLQLFRSITVSCMNPKGNKWLRNRRKLCWW